MPTNNVQALLAQDIPDPTDFSEANLRQMDASLRCTICGELYDAPVSLACGHCFCSLCIREHILRESECPGCRKPVSEAHFRINPALEGTVSAWREARPTVLELSRRSQTFSQDKTPRQLQTPVQNKRKRKRTEVSSSSDSDIVCTVGPSNARGSSDAEGSSPLQARSARKASRRRANMEPSSDPREELLQPGSLVECPMCGDSVEFQAINTHMDGPDCGQKPRSKKNNLLNPNAKQEWSKILGNKSEKAKGKRNSESDDTMERLPKVSYDVLKDKALKELLSSQQLPVNGDRKARIARHRRWVMIVNANLDKTVGRKSASDLRLELRAWEARKGHTYVVEDPSAHEVLHDEEFIRLIREAQRGSSRLSALGGTPEKDDHEEHD